MASEPTQPTRAGRPARPEDVLRHADALYNLARYLTREPSEAEDLVQETYLRALRGWGGLAPDGDVRAWLFRILRNAFLSRCRRVRRLPESEPYDTVDDRRGAARDEGPLAGDEELGRLRRLVSADIEAALRSLQEEARTTILLDLEGFTESEVAGVLGCAVGTVKSRLSRARAALRRALADYRPEEAS